MVKREEQKQNTREKLLAAAAQCFTEKGYSGCSIADIAQRAEIAQGTMYVHFKSKEELFKTMIEEEHAQGAEKARQAANVTPYLNGIIGVMTDCIRDVGFPVDHRLWTEILAVAAREPSVRETFAASDKAMRSVFVELLQKAAEAGEIDGSLDFEAISVWLYALVDGLIARTADDPCFDFQRHLEVFEVLIRRALRPQN
ncbi:MAG: TetR/AcrR family transcriptional regulator [Desulfovibrio sp.]|jgi:AcrR family transcriptional regulator|nr:TetR/AcrR family transcriptional regulator [Desulfovibrio sp.]